MPKRELDFIAYGPGFSGSYATQREAEAVVKINGEGAVYKRVPVEQFAPLANTTAETAEKTEQSD